MVVYSGLVASFDDKVGERERERGPLMTSHVYKWVSDIDPIALWGWWAQLRKNMWVFKFFEGNESLFFLDFAPFGLK